MTVCMVTIPHMLPPFQLLQQLIHVSLCSHTVMWIKDGSCRKVSGCFFPLIHIGLSHWFTAHVGEERARVNEWQILSVFNNLQLKSQPKVPVVITLKDVTWSLGFKILFKTPNGRHLLDTGDFAWNNYLFRRDWFKYKCTQKLLNTSIRLEKYFKL